MKLGYETLATATGVTQLVSEMRETVFPYKDQEAKELYRVGHEANGMMSRQPGESMYAYIKRAKCLSSFLQYDSVNFIWSIAKKIH